jgi:hypothetical protein
MRHHPSLIAVYVYLATSAMVLGAVLVSTIAMEKRWNSFCARSSLQNGSGTVLAGTNAWDGVWYAEIARFGYHDNGDDASNVVFFPGYPLLGWITATVFGLPTEAALLLVSHFSLLLTFALFGLYLKDRFPSSPESCLHCILLLGLWPTTCFFRMTYSESLFLLSAITAMYGMNRNWCPYSVAIVIGFAAVVRPVGIALLAAFVWWRHEETVNRGAFLTQVVIGGICCTWAVGVFLLYQCYAFGTPVAFLDARSQWSAVETTLGGYCTSLITLRPLWAVYCPATPSYWQSYSVFANPIMSLQFANPIFVVVTTALIAIGSWKGILNTRETIFSAVLIFVAYTVQAEAAFMQSQGRYMAVVYPFYIVAGHVVARLTIALRIPVYGASAGLLLLYSCLFAAWYPIY